MKVCLFVRQATLGLGGLLLLEPCLLGQTGPGTALEFDGQKSFVLAPAINSSGPGVTVEAWVKPTNLTGLREQVVVRQASNASYDDFVLKFTGYGSQLSFGCRFQAGASFGYVDITASINPNDFQDGKWHHIAGSYNSDTTRRLYRDGVKIADLTSSLSYPPQALGGAVSLGAAVSGTGATLFYAGGLDEVRIWTEARTPEEICQTLTQPLSGTEPQLAAYWRLNEGTGTTASDSSGHGLTGNLSNSPAWIPSGAFQAVPLVVVTTGSASNLTSTSSVLSGSASFCSFSTTGWFEYGASTSYGQTTPPLTLPNGPQPVPFAQMISGLAPDTIYYFRAVASNSGGRWAGTDAQFRTPGAPKVVTLVATNVTPWAAALLASIDPDGLDTTTWIEWGTSTSYGTSTPLQLLLAGSGLSTNTQTITNLVPAQTYHFRAVATNSAGTTLGQDQAFTTPSFTNAFSGGYPLQNGSVAWGDYNGDGNLDLVITGSDSTNSHTILYRNDVTTFTCQRDLNYYYPCQLGGLPGVAFGSAAWGDYNNDGTPDLLLSGSSPWSLPSGLAITAVCPNVNGTFSSVTNDFPEVSLSSAAWGDYDNDGHLDFFVTGIVGYSYYNSSAYPTNGLFHNNGDGTFTEVPTDLPAVFNGSVAWGDFDNDGQLDLAIMGNNGTSNLTRIYRNEHGVFTDINANLPGICCGSLAWGDFDNDGQLDLLLVGQTNTSPDSAICRIYRNDHGTFTDIAAGLPAVVNGAAAWGDVDGDGQLDLVLIGHDNSLPSPFPSQTGQDTARIFRNDHGLFTDINAGLCGLSNGGVAWGDFDNDGRLDIAIVSGWGNSQQCGFGLQVYRSLYPQAPSNPYRPSAPTVLAASVRNNGAVLSWNAGTDAHTPTAGLTYNVRVGTTPGGVQTVPPQSDSITGQRRLPQMGNAGHCLFMVLTNLPVGLYYWSAQAVNNSFAGSAWAPEQSFAVTSGPPVAVTSSASTILGNSARLSGLVSAGGLPTRAWFEWGTTAALGNSTPAVALGTGLLPQAVSQPLSNLSPLTTYFFRLAATNDAGLAQGTNATFTTLGPPPITATLGASNITYTSGLLVGACPQASAPADYFIEWGPTSQYGNLAPALANSPALRFDGVDDMVAVGWGKFPTVTNNFTIELWANATGARAETSESTVGTSGLGSQQYAVFPDEGATSYSTPAHTGAGLSIGPNGVSVMEHSDYYMPTVLVYKGGIAGWTHIALVYSNQVPLLYIGGSLVRAGLVTGRIVHPSADLGGTTNLAYGQFTGALQEVRIWDIPLDEPTLQAWINSRLTPAHPFYSHLQGYWPLNEGQGLTTTDLSPRGNVGQLLNGPEWDATGWALDADAFSAALTNLAPGGTYHFRAVAVNPAGTAYGADQTFTTLPRPQVLQFSFQPGTGSWLGCMGTPDMPYIVEGSSNLVNWVTLSNLRAAPDGSFQFIDTDTTNASIRFYRLRVP